MRLRQAKKIMKNFRLYLGMLCMYGTQRVGKANNIVLHHYSRVKPGIKAWNALMEKDLLLVIKIFNESIKSRNK